MEKIQVSAELLSTLIDICEEDKMCGKCSMFVECREMKQKADDGL